ncbi:glycosyltransferase family 4 protein [Mariniphaga anaerophila]|nr:glycosyltransferase family 1 protein [Mariniphaga anaerophila]
MVIVVNTRLLLKGRLEGIGWFTFQSLKRITANHPEHQFIFVFDRPYSDEFIFSKNVTPVVIGPPARHPVLFYLWFEFQIPRVLKKYKADLFLSPDGYLSLNTSVPQLAVIHDINFAHRPQDLPRVQAFYYNYFFPKFARKAARIATVSAYSKKDIATTYKIDNSKIDVVYDGCNDNFTPVAEKVQKEMRGKYTQGFPFFLFVGALHPRKNVEGLLKAFDRFKQELGGTEKLLIVGGQMHKTGTITSTWKNMQFKDEVIFTGRVSSEELSRIFGSALSLVFVPFFEGFGIPILEAMNAGVPVICSNTTSMPEVGGDAVLYADPENTEQIAEAMHKMASDSAMRNELIQKGYQQKMNFSWDKTAGLLWESILQTLK